MDNLARQSTIADAVLDNLDNLADFYDQPDPCEFVQAPNDLVTGREVSNIFRRHQAAPLALGHRQDVFHTDLATSFASFYSEPVPARLAMRQHLLPKDAGKSFAFASVVIANRLVLDRKRASGDLLFGLTYGVWGGPLEVAIHELGRLPDGWAGEGSKAPSTSILLDIQSLNSLLPPSVTAPEIDVDQDDGFVSLRWFDAGAVNSLTITFFGGHKIIVTLSSLEGNDRAARQLNIRDVGEVTSFLSDTAFESLLTSNALP